jgi:hypothetical protein
MQQDLEHATLFIVVPFIRTSRQQLGAEHGAAALVQLPSWPSSVHLLFSKSQDAKQLLNSSLVIHEGICLLTSSGCKRPLCTAEFLNSAADCLWSGMMLAYPGMTRSSVARAARTIVTRHILGCPMQLPMRTRQGSGSSRDRRQSTIQSHGARTNHGFCSKTGASYLGRSLHPDICNEGARQYYSAWNVFY